MRKKPMATLSDYEDDKFVALVLSCQLVLNFSLKNHIHWMNEKSQNAWIQSFKQI